MLIKITGDLIDLACRGKFTVLVHGCNCMNTMGAGFARKLAATWPIAREADARTIKGDRNKLGTCSVGYNISIRGTDSHKLTIFNAYTQYAYGPPHEKHFDLDALRRALTFVRDNTTSEDRIGMPLIGAGLGGGQWSDIEPVIAETLKDRHVTIVALPT